MARYLEEKATYSRLLAGDGTALTETGGALNVHTGSYTHVTTTIFELLEIGLESSDDTEPIDFGAVGSLPFDGMVLYITNNANQDTTVTGYTSPDGVTYYPYSTSNSTVVDLCHPLYQS